MAGRPLRRARLAAQAAAAPHAAAPPHAAPIVANSRTVNRAIAAAGIPVTLYKGKGYFYIEAADGTQVDSIYVPYWDDYTVDEWVEHVRYEYERAHPEPLDVGRPVRRRPNGVPDWLIDAAHYSTFGLAPSSDEYHAEQARREVERQAAQEQAVAEYAARPPEQPDTQEGRGLGRAGYKDQSQTVSEEERARIYAEQERARQEAARRAELAKQQAIASAWERAEANAKAERFRQQREAQLRSKPVVGFAPPAIGGMTKLLTPMQVRKSNPSSSWDAHYDAYYNHPSVRDHVAYRITAKGRVALPLMRGEYLERRALALLADTPSLPQFVIEGEFGIGHDVLEGLREAGLVTAFIEAKPHRPIARSYADEYAAAEAAAAAAAAFDLEYQHREMLRRR